MKSAIASIAAARAWDSHGETGYTLRYLGAKMNLFKIILIIAGIFTSSPSFSQSQRYDIFPVGGFGGGNGASRYVSRAFVVDRFQRGIYLCSSLWYLNQDGEIICRKVVSGQEVPEREFWGKMGTYIEPGLNFTHYATFWYVSNSRFVRFCVLSLLGFDRCWLGSFGP
jgi:hypothetical protein